MLFRADASGKTLDIAIFAEQVLVLGVELKEIDQHAAGVICDHCGASFGGNNLYERLKAVRKGQKTFDSDGRIFHGGGERGSGGGGRGVCNGNKEDECLVGDDGALVCEHVNYFVQALMLNNAVDEIASVTLGERSQYFNAGQSNAPICFVEEIESAGGVTTLGDYFPSDTARLFVRRRVHLDAFENDAAHCVKNVTLRIIIASATGNRGVCGA